MFKKKRALCEIAKNFVLFENEASYKDFFTHKCLSRVTDTLCTIFSQNLI